MLCSRKGCGLCGCDDRNIEGANEIVSNIINDGGHHVAVKVDVQSSDELDAMAKTAMDTFGRVNILISDAGARVIKEFLEQTNKDCDMMLGINLLGPF